MSDEIKIFIQAVADMRDLQKRYFRARNAGQSGVATILQQAKAKERQVDGMIAELSKPDSNQQSLFATLLPLLFFLLPALAPAQQYTNPEREALGLPPIDTVPAVWRPYPNAQIKDMKRYDLHHLQRLPRIAPAPVKPEDTKPAIARKDDD